MTGPEQPSKITSPVISGVFKREELFRSLDSMRDRPAVWISGPAGAGKTTLAASYLSFLKIPHTWYQMDRTDEDPATFFYYMGLAAKRLPGRSRKALPLFTAEYAGGLPAFTSGYFEALFGRLKPPHVLVFDNSQEAMQSTSIQEIIARAVLLAPAGIQCLLISRCEPPPRLVYMLANRRMEHIGWEAIKFSLAESEAFINAYGKKKVSVDAILELHEKTQGWAAGLSLLLQEMKMAGTPEGLSSVRPENIFDYFAGEILEKMEGSTVEFLLKASSLPKIPERLAGKLTGLETAGKILSRLSRSNYFIERRNTPPVYQFHPLFREFLASRAAETYSKEDIFAMKRASAALLEEAGETGDAAELWMECEDWAALSRVILKNAQTLLTQGRIQTLNGWISKIPGEMLEGSPWLLYWSGICLMGTDTSRARGHLEKAFRTFVSGENTGCLSGEDMAGALLCWSFIVDSYLYEWDDFSDLGGWIDRLYSLMAAADFKFPSSQIEARVSASMTCAMVSTRPWHPDAEKWAEKALVLAKNHGDPACQIQTLNFAAYFYGWRGDFNKSLLLTEEFRTAASRSDVSPLFKISWLSLSAVNNLFLTPSPARALDEITLAHEISRAAGIKVMNHFIVVGAFAALANGDFKKADEILKGKERANIQGRIGLSHFLFVLAYREFLAGNLVQASAHAEAALKYAAGAKYPYASALCHFGSAQIKHSMGLHEQADAHIRAALELSAGSKIFDFMCISARAQFCFDKGEYGQGLEYLREGFRIGRERNYPGFIWWWDPPAMAGLCAKALEAEIEPHYARELVLKRGLTDYAGPVEVENWPWPVKVHTLGEFRIELGGHTLEPHGKPQQKPLALLKMLIALGQRDIPEGKITDLLWPEAEGDLAHKSFEMTCARLRGMIGAKAVQVRGGLVTLGERHCWTDLRAITRIISGAETWWRKAGLKEKKPSTAMDVCGLETAMDLTEKALALYKGDFLPADPGQAWAIAARGKVKNALLRLTMKAGKHLQQRGQWEMAARKYEKALELDNLVEELYQDLMLCQINLGRRAQAARTYRQCKKALRASLGIDTSPATDNIYKKINI